MASTYGLTNLVSSLGFSHLWRRSCVDLASIPKQRARRQQAATEDVLTNTIADAEADCVISTFGLKTFSPQQLEIVALELARILKPGGSFALLEISSPPSPLLRPLFMAYIQLVVPLIGMLFLGNPSCYRYLARYTKAFGSCRPMVELLREAGLEAEFGSHFFGCATSVSGRRLLDR